MVTLYECTIFASLTLIAIVIAIFVFASSIHGGASKISAEEEENLLARRRERMEEAREPLSERIKDLSSGRSIQELKAEIVKLDNDLRNIDRSILKARNKAKALTVRNMVALPSSFLLISIVGSGIAVVTSGNFPLIMWSLSLLLIVVSLCFIFKNLVIIEGFSSVMDLSTVIEQALKGHEVKLEPVAVIGKGLQEEVATVLLSLPPKESRIIAMYFGIGFAPMSVEEIAKEFGVTRETIRRRLARALRMSRHPSRSRRLKEYLDSIPVTGERTGEQRFIEGIFGL